MVKTKSNKTSKKTSKKKSNKADNVNMPAHYISAKIESTEVVESFDLGFHLGNVVKYVLRAGKKNSETKTEDLKKAFWYLNRKIHLLENPKAPLKPSQTQI